MIKYKLKCNQCSKIFDSWFSSSKEYDKVKKLNMLNCNYCSSENIDKTIMSPNIKSNNRSSDIIGKNNLKDLKEKIKNYQNLVKKNFKYVGNDFPFEARSIHYSNKKGIKGVYGEAKIEELKELREEGINTQIIPWFNDKEN